MSNESSSTLRPTPEQILIAGSLLGIAALSWWLTVVQQSGMMEAGMYEVQPVALVLFASSWTIGMIAMMFPTTIPMMLLFVHVGKSSKPEVQAGGGPTVAKAILFIVSYISIWAIVGIVIYLAAAAVSSFLPATKFSIILGSSTGVALALILVGAYQLSPLKGECLERCHPTSFLFKYYRGGLAGSIKMGLLYAKYCVGCCWVMMVFLLLVGAMGVIWMAVFAGLIFAERTILHSRWPSRLLGVAFLAAGGVRLAVP